MANTKSWLKRFYYELLPWMRPQEEERVAVFERALVEMGAVAEIQIAQAGKKIAKAMSDGMVEGFLEKPPVVWLYERYVNGSDSDG